MSAQPPELGCHLDLVEVAKLTRLAVGVLRIDPGVDVQLVIRCRRWGSQLGAPLTFPRIRNIYHLYPR